MLKEIEEGNIRKRETIMLFSHCQVGEATSGYYKCKIDIPMLDCILSQINLSNTVIFQLIFFLFLLTPTVFLPSCTGGLQKNDVMLNKP